MYTIYVHFQRAFVGELLSALFGDDNFLEDLVEALLRLVIDAEAAFDRNDFEDDLLMGCWALVLKDFTIDALAYLAAVRQSA